MSMNNGHVPLEVYAEKMKELNTRKIQLVKARSWISIIRLIIFIVMVAALFLNSTAGFRIEAIIAVAGIAALIFFIVRSTDYKNELDNTERLILINQHEIDVLNNNYYRYENGNNFSPASHPYALDIDTFGQASLFQYINRCNAEQAKLLLADRLLNPLTPEAIFLQQEAAKELTGKLDWKQQFLSYGKANPVTLQTEKRIEQWVNQPDERFTAPFWNFFVHAYSVIAVAIVVLYAAGLLGYQLFIAVLLLFCIFSLYLSKTVNKTYLLLSRVFLEVKTLYEQLTCLEKETFNATCVTQIKDSLRSNAKLSVSKEIYRLQSILNRFDMRLNALFFLFLNTFFLWDLRQMLALNRWKKQNADTIPAWFAAIAQMEVLISLSSLVYNETAWCFPTLVKEHFTFNGREIGHPLIDKKNRITNSFALSGLGKVALVTGSNMGGKSTFLRSIGVNIVLALMGAPVCARSFTLSPVRLMSSMRITDNLAENTSTFYAELKKLQSIIQVVNRKEKVFILLDEILRGTNSLDRHTGSKALVRQLIEQQAVAIIATHDVELARLQDIYEEAIVNYHFDVQVADGELFFDYKLKEGICRSLNASILMRKIGIEI